MLIELFMHGKTIICETCGFDYNPPPNAKDLVSNITLDSDSAEESYEKETPEEYESQEESEIPESSEASEPSEEEIQPENSDNAFNEYSNQVPKQPDWAQPPPITQNGKFSKITEKNILKALSSNWKSMRELARELNIQDAREFYILRMTLNDMNRKGLITMDFQIDRVLIRRKK
jgi:hypothetical protein